MMLDHDRGATDSQGPLQSQDTLLNVKAGQCDADDSEWGQAGHGHLGHRWGKESAVHAAEQTHWCRDNGGHFAADQLEAEHDSSLQEDVPGLQGLRGNRGGRRENDELCTDVCVSKADHEQHLSQVSQPPEDWQHSELCDVQWEPPDLDCIQVPPQDGPDPQSASSVLSVFLPHSDLITTDDLIIWADAVAVAVFHHSLSHLLCWSGLHHPHQWWHWPAAVHHKSDSLNSERAALLCREVKSALHHLHCHSNWDHSCDGAAEMPALLLGLGWQHWEGSHTCSMNCENTIVNDGDHQCLQTWDWLLSCLADCASWTLTKHHQLHAEDWSAEVRQQRRHILDLSALWMNTHW